MAAVTMGRGPLEPEREGRGPLPPSPFLFHFVDDCRGVALDETGSPADLREFLRSVLPASLAGNGDGARPRVLVLTGARDHEADVVGVELLRRGCDYVRWNLEDMPSRTSVRLGGPGAGLRSAIEVGPDVVALDHVGVAWFRQMSSAIDPPFSDPVANIFAVEEWERTGEAVAGSLACAWVNHPAVMRSGRDRLRQLRLASSLGLEVPRTLVTNDPGAVEDFRRLCGGDILAKSLGIHWVEHGGRRVDVFGRRINAEDLALVGDVRHVPSIFQEYVPKRVEIRVTVVGDRVFAAEIHSQATEASRAVFHRGELERIPIVPHDLPLDVERKCRAVVARLGLQFSGIDLILTPEGRYVFLESNANGSWRWIEMRTGQAITAAMADLLTDLAGDIGRRGERASAEARRRSKEWST